MTHGTCPTCGADFVEADGIRFAECEADCDTRRSLTDRYPDGGRRWTVYPPTADSMTQMAIKGDK